MTGSLARGTPMMFTESCQSLDQQKKPIIQAEKRIKNNVQSQHNLIVDRKRSDYNAHQYKTI